MREKTKRYKLVEIVFQEKLYTNNINSFTEYLYFSQTSHTIVCWPCQPNIALVETTHS